MNVAVRHRPLFRPALTLHTPGTGRPTAAEKPANEGGRAKGQVVGATAGTIFMAIALYATRVLSGPPIVAAVATGGGVLIGLLGGGKLGRWIAGGCQLRAPLLGEAGGAALGAATYVLGAMLLVPAGTIALPLLLAGGGLAMLAGSALGGAAQTKGVRFIKHLAR